MRKLEFVLKPSTEIKGNSQLSPMFHGFIMENIDTEYASYLHENHAHPYSQYSYINKDTGNLIWCINATNEDAESNIINKLESLTEIDLRFNELHFDVLEKKTIICKQDSLMKDYFFGECSRVVKIKILSPMSFKTENEYALFPSVRLIVQSIMNKYDASNINHTDVFSDEVLANIVENSRIIGYRLKSTGFFVGLNRIPSFTGEITIRINGPQQMVNLFWMLLKFGEYSGVGIKTSMGMGHIEIMENDK